MEIKDLNDKIYLKHLRKVGATFFTPGFDTVEAEDVNTIEGQRHIRAVLP